MSAIAPTSAGSQYTDEDRRLALSTYAVYGNVTKTAEIINIPRQTINGWKVNSDWWEAELSKIRQEKSDELDASYSRAIEQAVQQVIDRIENGDEIITSQGDKLRKLMSGKDLATTMGIVFDKRQLLRNQPTSIKSSVDDKALMDLKAQFEALAGRTIDGERVR